MATTARLHISALAVLQPRVMSAVSTAGLTSVELGEMFYRHISASCVQCELGLTGEELSQLALAESAEQLTEAKLARLRQGYCGRDGCNSYYYNVRFEDHPKVNWEILMPALKAAPAPSATPTPVAAEADADPNAAPRGWRAWLATTQQRIIAGLVVLAVLLVARHMFFGGKVTLFRPKPHYQISTNTLHTLIPPPAASTNAATSFAPAKPGASHPPGRTNRP
jgi:hypothetical protein